MDFEVANLKIVRADFSRPGVEGVGKVGNQTLIFLAQNLHVGQFKVGKHEFAIQFWFKTSGTRPEVPNESGGSEIK